MNLPFPNRENRELSMRDQIIARLLEYDPTLRQSYLETLKDFALIQALEVRVWSKVDAGREEMETYMFNAGMDYERERIVKSLTETRRMEAGTLIASWSNK